MPAEVDLVQVAVVGQHDDLGGELRLRRGSGSGVQLVEQFPPVVQPPVADHHRAEVHVHLVTGGDEVVDRGDPVGDRRGADVEQLGVAPRHQREPDPGAALRVPVQQVAVDVLGGEAGLGGGQPPERLDQVADVVADPGVEAAVGVLADVVDPGLGVALVRGRLHALAGDVPLHVPGDLVDVGEHGDRVAVPLAPGDVAVRARHRATVGGGRGDEVGRPAVGACGQRLLDAQHERLPLDPDPPADVGLVAVELGNAVVALHLDPVGVREPGQDLASPGQLGRGRLEVDPADVQQVAHLLCNGR
jgi:hypothetical protein